MSFEGLLWVLVLSAAFFLCVFPLLRNFWAYCTWDRVPCWHAKDGNKFFFEREGVYYYGNCHTFWDSLDLGVNHATSQFPVRSDDSICYVSRSSPWQAIDALDSYKHFDRLLPRLGISATLVVVVLVINRRLRKRSANR